MGVALGSYSEREHRPPQPKPASWILRAARASFDRDRKANRRLDALRVNAPTHLSDVQSERGIRNRPARKCPMEVSYPGRSLGPTGRFLQGIWLGPCPWIS